MEEEMNQEGLGMIQGAQQAPVQEEKFVAKPNIALERYNNNIVNDIRNQAKQEAIQEIAHQQSVNQEIINREKGAIDYGRSVGMREGLNEGIDLGFSEALRYSEGRDSSQSGAMRDEDTSYAQNYAMNDTEDEINNEMDYVDNSGLGMV